LTLRYSLLLSVWVDPSAEHIFSLFCEYIHLDYVRVPVIYRVDKAEYVYSYACGCVTGIREYVFNT